MPRMFGAKLTKCDDYVFNRVDIETDELVPENDKEVHATAERCIQDNDHSTVFMADLMGSPVILKCCYNTEYHKDFWFEGRVYHFRLKELQGTVVPVCFGYYLGVDDVYGPYSILLLEYCGESISRIFEHMEIKERVEILTLLGKFHHKAQLHPADFAERNVVVRNGKYRLIDFHDMRGHKCDWTEDHDWNPGQPLRIIMQNFSCGVLAQVADEAMALWDTCARPMVKIHGRHYPEEGLPSQEIIDQLIPQNFVGVPQNWAWAEAYLKQVRKEMDSDSSFDIKRQIAKRPFPPVDPDEHYRINPPKKSTV